MEPSVTSVLLRLGAVLALVAADGMFGAAEFAIVSVRRTRLIPLIERGSKRARRVLRAAEKPDAFIAATQLGITMASLGLGWIGEPAGARLLEPLVAALPGALPEATAFGLPAPSGPHVYSPEEIGLLVTESRRAGVVEEAEALLVHRVFKFADTLVEEVMVPRVSVRGVPNDAAVQDAVTVVREAGFSRIPVFAEDLDHIVGMVHAKDLLVAQAEDRGPEPVDRVMRPVLYVPETKPVVDLLEEMRRQGIQLAVVLDEFGGTSGIVTIEDLLEELVGEIPGEFRPERRLVVLQQADRIIVDAAIPLDDLNERFRIALPTTEANPPSVFASAIGRTRLNSSPGCGPSDAF